VNRWQGKVAAVLTGAAGIMVLAAGTAQAHVRVSAPQAVVGRPATFDFRVPSEEQVAATIRLSVTVPADVTITDVPPPAGWIAVMARDGAGDTVVTWTAQGAGLQPAQSIDFLASASALPDRPTVSFDAVQTYSNGDMVYWNQQQVGATEPPFPAPVLTLAGATPGVAPDSVALTPTPRGAPAPKPSTPVHVTAAPATPSSIVVPQWTIVLGIGGGIAVVTAIFVVVFTVLRLRRTRATR
jgi:periplasmic copper chaperone A